MRSAAGTGGGDGSGLLRATTLGDRARGTHTAAGAEAGQDYWWHTAREAWGDGGDNQMKMNGSLPPPTPPPPFYKSVGQLKGL